MIDVPVFQRAEPVPQTHASKLFFCFTRWRFYGCRGDDPLLRRLRRIITARRRRRHATERTGRWVGGPVWRIMDSFFEVFDA